MKRIIITIMLALPLAVNAQMMSSSNYRIPFDAVGGGGLRSESANFAIEDTVSEFSSPTGEDLASSNYAACVGYQMRFPNVRSAPRICVCIAVAKT